MVSAANCLRLGLIFNFISCSAMFRRFLVDPIAVSGNSYKRNPRAAIDNHPYGWETAYYEVPIDNFAFIQNFTYPMKYLYNITFYKPGGPIFFYTGNEGLIEDFAKNTGIMFDLAPMFNAALLFAQHRYYAHPLPFGNFTFTDVKYLAYLDSTQALADFAKLIPYVKSSLLNCSDETPVIAFGGSYGGELAAWMRIKYAHIITGAWSASAPLAYYKGGGVSPGAFDHVVMRDFLDAGCKEKTIINGLDALISLANNFRTPP
ncbi:Putative serine protease pcp-1 [Toxocara canis]|uniref:Putative serine protease pcp-1 n=1 Tax=Toxocara canis TaxID=6265 RepID=A0A0B2VNP3_TOXCA|nr:Putative serine protease pcp-1 [Toxocara canis]